MRKVIIEECFGFNVVANKELGAIVVDPKSEHDNRYARDTNRKIKSALRMSPRRIKKLQKKMGAEESMKFFVAMANYRF